MPMGFGNMGASMMPQQLMPQQMPQQGGGQGGMGGLMEKLFGFGGMSGGGGGQGGGMDPRMNALMVALRGMGNASQGQGFGQGAANAYFGQMQDARMLEAMSYDKQSRKEMMELRKSEVERQTKADELRTTQWVAAQGARTEDARLAADQRAQFHEQRMEAIKADKGASQEFVDQYVKAYGDTPENRQKAISLYGQRFSSSMFSGLGGLGGGGLGGPAPDPFADVAAELEGGLTTGRQNTGPPAAFSGTADRSQEYLQGQGFGQGPSTGFFSGPHSPPWSQAWPATKRFLNQPIPYGSDF